MAYKGKHYQVPSAMHLIETIKDFLVSCGWTTVGPSTDLASRQAQDDEHAHILGWFLHSNGEDGQQDLHMHMHVNRGYNIMPIGTEFSYLNGAINDSVTTIPVDDGSLFTNNSIIKIDAELIQVGTVVSNNLTGCTRGYGGTTAASHSDDDVVLELAWGAQGATDVTCARPCIEIFSYRDLTNELDETSGSVGWTIGDGTTSGTITGLTGYDDDKFNDHALIRINGGSDDGKMRWITDYTGSDGSMSYQKFASAPGAQHVHIVSGGFLPPASRRMPTGGTANSHLQGNIYDFPGALGSDTNVWLYGSKDGVMVVTLRGSTYRAFYFGGYTPLSSPLTTTTTASASAGATSIFVTDTNQFTDGGVYRLVSQDIQDWKDNWDRSSDTSMGASPGDWPDLDPEEIPTELIKVAPGGINGVTGEITLVDPLFYSYESGAKVGEDPCPFCRYTCADGQNSTVREQFTYELYAEQDTDDNCTLTPFRAVPYNRSHTDTPSHRQASRCYVDHDTPWSMLTTYNETYFPCALVSRLYPGHTTNILTTNTNRVNQQLPLIPFVIEASHSSETYDGENYAAWNRLYGVIPFTRAMANQLSAAPEDTVRSIWSGSYETFRVFNIEGATWMAFGPEIWP
jgi:hypothetical protein